MAGEQVWGAAVGWTGLAGDRRWAFVQDGMERDGFPWLTIREHAEMWRYQPSFTDPERPNASRTMVRTPSGGGLGGVDPKLAAELAPGPERPHGYNGARVLKQGRGVFDTMPLSLMSTQTVAEIGAMAGTEVTPLRFRPNLVVEALDDAASFPEDEWVGHVLRVGGMRMRVDKRDQRCV